VARSSRSSGSSPAPAARRGRGPAADTAAPLAPRGEGRGGDWRALPRGPLHAWLAARPTVADAAWTRVAREPGEARPAFLVRVLGPLPRAARGEGGGVAAVLAVAAFGPLGAAAAVAVVVARALGAA